jgi:hypothetical protein
MALGRPTMTDRKESAMKATNSDGPDLSRVFAPMLSELEDHATRLTQRQAELARELAGVDEELARVEAVRAAMVGKATTRGPGRPRKASESGSAKQSRERGEAILAWAGRHDAGEFTVADVAEGTGFPTMGIGPTLAAMAQRGEVVRAGENPKRYRLA